MSEQRRTRLVIGEKGRIGQIDQFSELADSQQSTVLVKFDTGEEALIPFDQLKLLSDGDYYLASEANIEQWKTGSISAHGDQVERPLVVPVIEEEIKIGKRVHQEKVQISKQIHEEEVQIDEPGFREEIEIERISKNEVLDAPVSPYTEGDIVVIPIVEERVVVAKRLVLVEEIRVKKVRREVRKPQSVKLRREEILIDRDDQNRDDQ
ncbi:MAG: YsnF/AvaK domain-containing protein [Chloroflexota bacterium]|jgi:uncharacterized protein (TIGR02271 family)